MPTQLTTCGVLIQSTARSQADGNTPTLEHPAECLNPLRGRSLELLFLYRVVGNQIDMTLKPANTIGKLFRMLRLVIELSEKDVLETDPPSSDIEVVAAIL